MVAENKSVALIDYQQSLNTRIEEGQSVKAFQNEQRIVFGGQTDPKLRARPETGVAGHRRQYGDIVKEREEIKTNTNKVNCFVDINQPEFINTMSRTMDAFNVQISTFGGKPAHSKSKKMDKFMMEKGGYIKTQMEVLKQDEKAYKKGHGPAQVTNFTNKYRDQSSFATNRFKGALDVNKQKTEVLRTAEKIDPMDELKQSSIKFVHPESGDQNRIHCITNLADHQSGQKIANQEFRTFTTRHGSIATNKHVKGGFPESEKKFASARGSAADVQPYDHWRRHMVV